MLDLRQHMEVAQKAIAMCFYREGLAVHMDGARQGPHTLTYRVRLHEATKANLQKSNRLADAIEAAIRDDPVRIYTDRGAIHIEIPSPAPVTVLARSLTGNGLRVPIGMTATRAKAGIDFATRPHLLIVGPTGRGKTVAARGVAYQLARQTKPRHVRFIMSAFKMRDWAPFAAIGHTMAIVPPDQAVAMLDWVHDRMLDRARSGQNTPHLFLFVDDLLNLISVSDRAVVDPLAAIASLGRGAGIHLILSTQRLGQRGAGDAAITGNIDTRLVLGSADAQDAAFFSGRGKSGAEKIGRYPGDSILITDGGTYRLAVAWTNPGDLEELPRNPDAWEPWNHSEPVRTGSSEGARSGAGTSQTPPTPRTGSGGSTLVESGSQVVLTGEPVTPEELQAVLEVYRRTGSKNRTCVEVWGYKNGQTWGWLHKALSREATHDE